MVLLINGETVVNEEEIMKDISVFLKKYLFQLEDAAASLRNSSLVKVTAEVPALYVHQREFAIILRQDAKNIDRIGTDMATTCHIVVLRCHVTGVTALTHLDGMATKQGIHDMTCSLLSEVVHLISPSLKEIDIDLHIIGGFDDDRKLSENLCMDILREFSSFQPSENFPNTNFHLRTFCATTLNTTTILKPHSEEVDSDIEDEEEKSHGNIKSPVVFGIVVNCKTGEINNAVFAQSAKGPQTDLRSARSLNGVKSMANIYRPRESLLVLEPFTYKRMPHIEDWLNQPDHVIRRYMSTSPDVEPENFEQHIRETLRFIHNHPDPMQSIFKDGQPLIYEPSFLNGKLSWERR